MGVASDDAASSSAKVRGDQMSALVPGNVGRTVILFAMAVRIRAVFEPASPHGEWLAVAFPSYIFRDMEVRAVSRRAPTWSVLWGFGHQG